MAASVRAALGSTVAVGLVAVAAAGLVALSHDLTRERIAANERARLIAALNSVLDPALRDRDLATVRLAVTNRALLGSDEPIDVFVATENGAPVACVFATVAPDGYNTSIRLLVGVSPGGSVTGVRAAGHRETPGLGGRIDTAKSPWILQFDGKSLADPPRELWTVGEDESRFDALTGATVTSRAVVKAVGNTLLYFEQHRDDLFAQAAAIGTVDVPN